MTPTDTAKHNGDPPNTPVDLPGEQDSCPHPAWRVFAWIDHDGALCAGCCDCGEVLAGEAKPLTETEHEEA